MTAHTHREIVPGCYRCELSADEVKMTAAETIAAAIERLEEAVAIEGLRQASDDPGTLIDENALWVGEMMHHRSASDFVMLHHTIDAQLAILREEQATVAAAGKAYYWAGALDLARAILGEVSA